jgi:hypothetical protein
MRGVLSAPAVGLVLSLVQIVPVAAADCPDDSVLSGTVCIDKYEASVWYVPPAEKSLIRKIRSGAAELQDLTSAGAVQLGLAAGDLASAGCPVTGNGCVDVYAVSIEGVKPAVWITFFQAAAAARNSLKRLPTSQEWLVAAVGTPDGPPCNVGPDPNPAAVPALTGTAPGCVSDVGAFDLVGNLWEWVADWAGSGTSCFTQSATFGGDLNCLGGPGGSVPVIRGGFFGPVFLGGGTHAGVFAARSNFASDFSAGGIGFRSAR